MHELAQVGVEVAEPQPTSTALWARQFADAHQLREAVALTGRAHLHALGDAAVCGERFAVGGAQRIEPLVHGYCTSSFFRSRPLSELLAKVGVFIGPPLVDTLFPRQVGLAGLLAFGELPLHLGDRELFRLRISHHPSVRGQLQTHQVRHQSPRPQVRRGRCVDQLRGPRVHGRPAGRGAPDRLRSALPAVPADDGPVRGRGREDHALPARRRLADLSYDGLWEPDRARDGQPRDRHRPRRVPAPARVPGAGARRRLDLRASSAVPSRGPTSARRLRADPPHRPTAPWSELPPTRTPRSSSSCSRALAADRAPRRHARAERAVQGRRRRVRQRPRPCRVGRASTAADAVVAGNGTFPTLAIAHGVPTVLYSQVTASLGLVGEDLPIAAAPGALPRLHPLPVRRAGRRPARRDRARRGAQRGPDRAWKRRFIGEPFDAFKFVELVERIVRGEQPPPAIDDTRRFTTVALADELLERPELLRTYTERFKPGDDATLIVWAPGWTPTARSPSRRGRDRRRRPGRRTRYRTSCWCRCRARPPRTRCWPSAPTRGSATGRRSASSAPCRGSGRPGFVVGRRSISANGSESGRPPAGIDRDHAPARGQRDDHRHRVAADDGVGPRDVLVQRVPALSVSGSAGRCQDSAYLSGGSAGWVRSADSCGGRRTSPGSRAARRAPRSPSPAGRRSARSAATERRLGHVEDVLARVRRLERADRRRRVLQVRVAHAP